MNYRRLCDAPEVSFEELTRRPFDGPIRCLKCRTEALFAAPAEADTANWDVAPYFTLQPVCPNCYFGPWAMEFLVF